MTYQTETRLCGLSMPYQPGLPLDEIIKRVEPSRRPARALALWGVLIDGSGAQLSAGSELIPAQSAQTLPGGDGWGGFPARGSYIEGAAWIVMTLARALALRPRSSASFTATSSPPMSFSPSITGRSCSTSTWPSRLTRPITPRRRFAGEHCPTWPQSRSRHSSIPIDGRPSVPPPTSIRWDWSCASF